MENNISVTQNARYLKLFAAIFGIGIVLTIVTFSLNIAILVKVNKGVNLNQGDSAQTTTTTATPLTTITRITTITTTVASTTQSSTTASTTQPSTTSQLIPNLTLVTNTLIVDVMIHLNALQRIANESNGTRAINTSGFNRTLDYITDTLNNNNLYVNKTFFSVRDFALAENPILISYINDVETNYTYSANPSDSQFLQVKYSVASNISNSFEVTVIPNGGCTAADWENASVPTNERVAIVKRGGSCAFADRAAQGAKFNVSGILFYNDGTLPDRMSPIEVSLGQDNYLPVLFLSYRAGQDLANAALGAPMNVTVQIGINLIDLPNFPVGNICADTKTGDESQTIVVGSHSDSVPAGPGINDNGSGSAANLGLAIALARLYQTPTYAQYKYRVRFCWWGAEEVGLLGAKDHVKQAKNSTVVGERLTDYLINLNFDMLGSPNYMFGIYDGRTAKNDTPTQALSGSDKITALFRSWFEGQGLPWSYTDFSGRSDYGPFLAEGIVAGGLFSGADDIKTQEERDYYDGLLTQGMGGIAGVTHDPCYHKACDSIQNINKFAYEKMVQAAAYVIESLGRQDDLRTWLYSNGTASRFDT